MHRHVVALLSLITVAFAADLAPDALSSKIIAFKTASSFGNGFTLVETLFSADGSYLDIRRNHSRPVTYWYAGGEGTYTYVKTGADTAKIALTGEHPAEPSGVWNLTFKTADSGEVLSDQINNNGIEAGTFQVFDRAPVPLLNVSNRTTVSATKVSITGCVIGGNVPRLVLIKVLGPSLEPFGVSNFVPDPMLVVYDSSNTAIATNQSWNTLPAEQTGLVESMKRVLPLVGAQPFGSDREPGLLLELSPGAYTVHASSETAEVEGEVLTEVYFFR